MVQIKCDESIITEGLPQVLVGLSLGGRSYCTTVLLTEMSCLVDDIETTVGGQLGQPLYPAQEKMVLDMLMHGVC